MIGDFTGMRDSSEGRRVFPGFSSGESAAKDISGQHSPMPAQWTAMIDGAEKSEDLLEEEGEEGREEPPKGADNDKKEGGFFSNLIDSIKNTVNDSGIIPDGASRATEHAAGKLAGGGADGLGKVAGQVAKEGADDAGKAAGQAAAKGLSQTAGKALGKAVPVIGPLVTLGIDKLTTGSVTDKDLVSVGGGTAGGALGGALAGAALGSVVPGAGTAVGFLVGLGGGLLGGYLGGKAGEKAYDATGAKEKKII